VTDLATAPPVTQEEDDDLPAEVIEPDLPPGRAVELPGRGTTFVRELPGPPGAPVLVLLHGWTATADLNWFTCYASLGEKYRVIALDHRGHGGGIRSRRRFRLGDCADDVIALADLLEIERFIPVGYSMGGTIAQLIAHQAPQRVSGLVLCSTAGWFTSKRSDRLPFLSMAGLAALARVTSPQLQDRITQQMYLDKKVDKWEPWAVEQVSKHDWRMVLEAGQAIGTFTSREWLNELEMPTSIVMTIDDHVIPIRRQMALFERIRNAEAYRINGDHDAVAALADTYVPLLNRAVDSVISRITE
jgi:3-oxoadipate enol-lactonase